MSYQVIKRDGKKVKFELKKIENVIKKAFEAVNRHYEEDIIQRLALRTTADFDSKISDGCISVEDIQDCVEQTLIDCNYADVAKAYILYRKQRQSARDIGSSVSNYRDLVASYINSEETVNNHSIDSLALSNSAAITADYWLNEIYGQEIANAHKDGDINIDGLAMLSASDNNWSLPNLIKEGLKAPLGGNPYKPAKHFDALCNQMVNFLNVIRNEYYGPQYLNSFDTYLAPYIKNDKLSYTAIKQGIESFIYGINVGKRNEVYIYLDWHCPLDLADKQCLIGNELCDFTYRDCQKQMNLINKAVLEVLLEGDQLGNSFLYPIPIYSFSKDYDFNDNENGNSLFELCIKRGTPQFINYYKLNQQASDSRFLNNHRDLKFSAMSEKANSLIIKGEGCGHIGKVAINVPALAYSSESENEFFEKLNKNLSIARRSLQAKKDILNKLLKKGFYPYTSIYLANFNLYYGSIALAGLSQSLEAKWLNTSIKEEKGNEFIEKCLLYISDKLKQFQNEDKFFYDLAFASQDTVERFKEIDKLRYPDYQCDYCDGFLDNDKYKDLFSQLDVHSKFISYFTNPALYEIEIKGKVESASLMNLLNNIANNYPLILMNVKCK